MKLLYFFCITYLFLIVGCSYKEVQINVISNPDAGKSCNSSQQCVGKCIVPLQDINNPHCEYYNFSRGCYLVIEDFYKDNSSFKCID